MKKSLLSLIAIFTCIVTLAGERWSEERVNQWYDEHEWPIGCCFVPSYAVNAFEMWQADTFNPEIIDKELGKAADLGFNTVRIFLNDMVWSVDPNGFKDRIDTFLSLADKHGIKAIPTFFTNGGKLFDAKPGPQPEPIPGIHNSRWSPTPGAAVVNDPAQWPRIKNYVQDVLGRFANDDRVLVWCLYNEPENYSKGANSLPLLRAVFEWAREVDPSQPLTAPMWNLPCSGGLTTRLPIIAFLGENCDVISFHCYEGPEKVKSYIKHLKEFNRPMICTEYMGRPKSTFEEIMPLFKADKVGGMSFGLVQGKQQTHLQWYSKEGDPEPEVWFHDIFRPDGTPYSASEVEFIKSMTKDKPKKMEK